MPTLAGPSINAQSALRIPAISAAAELISEAAGTLPAKVFIRTEGGKEADASHAAHRLVHDEANSWTSAADLRTQLTCEALLNDNGGFALANRIDGRVVEFNRIEPTAVTIKSDDTGETVFLIKTAGRRRV